MPLSGSRRRTRWRNPSVSPDVGGEGVLALGVRRLEEYPAGARGRALPGQGETQARSGRDHRQDHETDQDTLPVRTPPCVCLPSSPPVAAGERVATPFRAAMRRTPARSAPPRRQVVGGKGFGRRRRLRRPRSSRGVPEHAGLLGLELLFAEDTASAEQRAFRAPQPCSSRAPVSSYRSSLKLSRP